jgi:hypothetical protein
MESSMHLTAAGGGADRPDRRHGSTTRGLTAIAVVAWGCWACLPASVGEWTGLVSVETVEGSPPASLADRYQVDAALVSSPFGGQDDCGIRVDVIDLGVFEVDGGVGCTDDGFDALLQQDAIVETSIATLSALRLNGVLKVGDDDPPNGTLTMQVVGDGAAWTTTFAGPAVH